MFAISTKLWVFGRKHCIYNSIFAYEWKKNGGIVEVKTFSATKSLPRVLLYHSRCIHECSVQWAIFRYYIESIAMHRLLNLNSVRCYHHLAIQCATVWLFVLFGVHGLSMQSPLDLKIFAQIIQDLSIRLRICCSSVLRIKRFSNTKLSAMLLVIRFTEMEMNLSKFECHVPRKK